MSIRKVEYFNVVCDRCTLTLADEQGEVIRAQDRRQAKVEALKAGWKFGGGNVLCARCR